MSPGVDASWNRIVAWLSRHAPPVAGAVNPPATEAALARAEAAVRTALPADLVAWWRRADGMRMTNPLPGALLPPRFVPCSVDDALESRRSWLAVTRGDGADPESSAGLAGSPCDTWLPVWLPIASDGGGTDLFVDLRDGPAHGCVMEYDKVGAAGYEDWQRPDVSRWPSVGAMLADVAAALEEETPVGGDRIWVDDDGAISWDSALSRWSGGGSMPVNVARLRERYATFVTEARAGGFGPPMAGSWSAEWIAAHVVRNTELLIATTEAVLAADPAGVERQRAAAWAAQDMARFRELSTAAERAAADIRYDNSDAMDPATLDRLGTSGLAALADQVEHLGARLCAMVEPLNRGRPAAHVRIVDDDTTGTTIVDERQGWLGVLNSLWRRQLPLRTRRLRLLR